MKNLKTISCLFIFPLLLFYHCGQKASTVGETDTKEASMISETESKQAIPVEIMVLKSQVIDKTIEYTANLAPFEENHLASSSPGKIEKIYVEIGDKVKKGQILVQMDRTQLLQAELQLKNLETDFFRLDTLLKTNTISQQQYDQVKMQYEVAKTNAEFLETNTRLAAPFNGTITGKYYEDGELYSGAPNTQAGKAAIVSVMQIDPLKAVVSVSEQFYPVVKEGMNALIYTDIYPGESFRGKIYLVHPTIDPMSRSFEVEVVVPNKNERLRPGMYARVALDLKKINALVVPAIAVLKLQGSNERYVFLNDHGTARRISVIPGKRFDDQIQVISDQLKEGDQLIISGQARLVDEDPVKVVNEQEG